MTIKLETSYQRLDRAIKWLKWFLVFLIVVIVFTELVKYDLCLSFSCVANYFVHISAITKTVITLLAALLATLVADRHITHSTINLENEQRAEVVQVTHRYIAIAKDLKANVSFLKTMSETGGHNLSTYIVIGDNIQRRYESLFEKDAYKYLPGSAVDLINDMSGSITGILNSIYVVEKAISANTNLAMQSTLPAPNMPVDSLLEEISKFIDKLYELRKSIHD